MRCSPKKAKKVLRRPGSGHTILRRKPSMLKPSSSPRSSLTFDDAMVFWRARERYHVQRFLSSLTLTLFLLEGLSFLLMGRWDLACLVCGMQWGLFIGGRGVLRWSRRRLHAWWHGAVIVLVLSVTLSGCQEMTRGVAHLYGYKGDPYASPCTQESLQAGSCVVKQGGK